MKLAGSYFTNKFRVSRVELCLTAVIFLAISFTILLAGKVLPRTFDISDTSHLIYHTELSSGRGLIATALKWADVNIGPRFAPLYGINGTFLAGLFGLDLTARGIYYGSAFAACGILLFIFMRQTGFSFIPAIFLPLLTLVGRQAEIWWIDYGENTGMIFLSLAAFFAAIGQRQTGWRRGAGDLLYLICLGLMSLPKESFIMVIPAMIFLKIYGDLLTNGSDLLNTLKINLFPTIAGLVLFLVEILWIVLKIGTVGAGYAGYEGFIPHKFFSTLWQLICASHVHLFLMAAGLAVWSLKSGILHQKVRSHVWLALLFCALVMVPCSLLYAKSGIPFAKYIVPGNFGLIFLSAVLLQRGIDSGLKKGVWVWVLVASLTVTLQIRSAIGAAELFSAESSRTTQALRLIESKVPADSRIAIVADPVRYCEAVYAFKEYLSFTPKQPQVYLLPLIRKHYTEFDKSLVKYIANIFKNRVLLHPHDAVNCFVVMPGMEHFFLLQTSGRFTADQFDRDVFKGYVIYSKR